MTDKADIAGEPTFAEMVGIVPGPKDPGYDEWLEAKLERAHREADDRSKLVPAEEVWEELGFGGYMTDEMDAADKATLEDLTSDMPGPKDPGYDEWLEAKLERARRQADDPSKLIPAEEVWKKLGLTY